MWGVGPRLRDGALGAGGENGEGLAGGVLLRFGLSAAFAGADLPAVHERPNGEGLGVGLSLVGDGFVDGKRETAALDEFLQGGFRVALGARPLLEQGGEPAEDEGAGGVLSGV